MKRVQAYLGWIERYRLRRLIVILLSLYLGVVVFFGYLYYLGRFVEGASSFWDYLYFSFVTQSTVGYGDLQPVSWGRLVVVIQTTLALALFALGTGVIIFRMLTPQLGSLEFDRVLLFYPFEKRFKFRFVNRLPVELSMADLEVRLRHYRTTVFHERKVSRKTVRLLQPLITRISSMKPLLSSTLPVVDCHDIESYDLGESIVLEPSHLDEESSVTVTMVAHYFSGNIVVAKEWPFSEIYCGKFASTYDDPEQVRWLNWGRYQLTRRSVCDDCVFRQGCPLKSKLEAV